MFKDYIGYTHVIVCTAYYIILN